MRPKQYLWNLMVSVDQFINTMFGGDPDETISSRVGKRTKHCRLCRLFCKVLGALDRNHCAKSIEPDRGKPWRRERT